jgi:hypothetical protein
MRPDLRIEPQVFDQVLPRLEAFMEPFVGSLVRKEQIAHARNLIR